VAALQSTLVPSAFAETENMSDSGPNTMKKRKANDGRATVPHDGGGGFLSSWLGYFSSGRRDGTTPTASSSTCGGENLTQKMDAMMQIMIRMEERQLATESRCERLESKCSVLEHLLGDMKECQLRQFEYNNMLVKNQSWKYSPPVHSQANYWEDGHDGDVAEYLADRCGALKGYTEKMRKGEFPHEYSDDRKGIDLEWSEEDPILDDDAGVKMRPHWKEFANALTQFTPAFGVLPDNCQTYFTLDGVQLPGGVGRLLKAALMNKPFQELSFVNKDDVDDNEGMTIDSILDIMDSNEHLRELTIGNNRIQLGHMEKICSVLCCGSIVELNLRNCFENGIGDDIMTYLLTNGGSNLQRLGLASNGITSSTITTLANFLATNPPLKELDLEDNLLVDNDAEVLANSLRSNSSLRKLQLAFNTTSDAGKEAFRPVLQNDSSLNSIADSNHSCSVEGVRFRCWNEYGFRKKGLGTRHLKVLTEPEKYTIFFLRGTNQCQRLMCNTLTALM
jgi:hypothetical protein